MADGSVDVWRVPLAQPDSRLGQFATLLSADEVERADRFRFPRHRRRFVVAHAALRLILGRYTGVPPTQLTFETNRFGKPRLTGDGVSFNLSHSGELALVAVTVPGRAVGVDVERIRPQRDVTGIARRFFSPREQEALAALPASEQERAFYHVWARKEAFIKAEGVGLTRGLAEFDVSVTPDGPAHLLAIRPDLAEAARWTLTAVAIDDGYTAAVVAAGRPLHLRRWRWSP